jgi:hypothetical protein
MSALDLSKLEKAKHKEGGIIIARCPACAEQGHDKTGNHLSIFANGRFGCVQFPRETGLEHRKRIFELVGVPDHKPVSAKAFDWSRCVAAEKHVEQIAEWRGFSPEFVRELRDNGQIGIYNGLVAFPVHNNGKVVGAHFRLKSGDWNYTPRGIKAAPLVFGELIPGERVNVFESTWDGLAYMDKSGERDGVLITRGSGNAKFATDLVPQNCTLFVWSQNDEPAAKWERDIVANTRCAVKRVKIPSPHKDLNDWTNCQSR